VRPHLPLDDAVDVRRRGRRRLRRAAETDYKKNQKRAPHKHHRSHLNMSKRLIISWQEGCLRGHSSCVRRLAVPWPIHPSLQALLSPLAACDRFLRSDRLHSGRRARVPRPLITPKRQSDGLPPDSRSITTCVGSAGFERGSFQVHGRRPQRIQQQRGCLVIDFTTQRMRKIFELENRPARESDRDGCFSGRWNNPLHTTRCVK